MSETEVEADLRRDTVWHRPSWPIGGGKPARFSADAFADPFELFADQDTQYSPPSPGQPQSDAMSVLNLHPPVTQEIVKARYKELVKVHHPDANGGDQASEENIKRINEAYATIMNNLA